MNHWGRIFFIYADAGGAERRERSQRGEYGDGRGQHPEPSAILGQPLDNHVDNCRHLLDRFNPRYFNPETRERLLAATQLHDDGKRETFRIRLDESGWLSYSFAGHRFRVPRSDPYVDGLIRAHHEFSVERVNSERAMLPSEADRRSFADDLYLLCMADQLEAELAVKAVEKRKLVPRTFMEFATEAVGDGYGTFRVVPWPFAISSLSMRIRLKELPPAAFRGKKAREIEKALRKENLTTETTIEITLTEDDFHER